MFEESALVRPPSMTPVDDLWYLAEEASNQAEQTYHSLTQEYSGFVEFETLKGVSRERFQRLAGRVEDNGAPYGAHTAVCNPSGDMLLVYHDQVEQWVLPGGETAPSESFREAAARELHEEAGVDGTYHGLGMLGRVRIRSGDHQTWGVLPVFEALSETECPVVSDPDDEVSDARWFDDLPPDTRDRTHLQTWRERRFGPDDDPPGEW